MKIIARVIVLIAMLLLLACCGRHIAAAGDWLNACCGAAWPAMALWGAVALLCLWCVLPLLLSLCKFVCGGRRAGVGHWLIWGGIVLLIYLGADLIDKGNALNELTPYPVLGYVFWGLIAIFLYWQLVAPIVSFCRLTTIVSADPRHRARTAMRNIRDWRQVARRESNDDYRRYDALYDSLHNACSCRDAAALQRLLAEYAEQPDLLPRRCRDLILNYCQISALTVVVSRNKWLDGAALLFLQLRLLIALAQLHGGKPSPVFNALCFGAVIANSFVYVVINGLLYGNGGLMVTELVDDIADLLVDDPEVQYKAGNSAANILPVVGKAFSGVVDVLARPTLEAALAASNVYVCGHLFLRRLQGESRMLGFKEVVAMRRKGRMDIFRGVAEALKDKCREKFGIGRTPSDTPEKLKDNNVPLS
ncbi:MAG: hypothetical protein Q4F40_00755 [Akkermansia sp.]|nr:hypothetical protein [Akkermansia sp.]